MDIYLREIIRSDLAEINRWRNDKNLIDYLAAPFRFIGKEIDERWFDGYLTSRSNNVRLAICKKDTSQIIGVVYLLDIDWINRSTEYAIMIGESTLLGAGAGFQATIEILNHAFNDLNLQRVSLTVLETNERARQLYKKVGFIEEGRLRKAVFKNGQYRDLICMSIFENEYKLTVSSQ